MADYVSSVRIPDLLMKLREGEYLVPQFQRDFVWSVSDIGALLSSIISSRPIGMLTLWEQPDNSGLELEHVSIPDTLISGDESQVYFGSNDDRTNKNYAILDGRQRCTAIAMAFGGLAANDARRKYSGKFYLNINDIEGNERIIFKKKSEIDKFGLSTLAESISKGLFPFEMDFSQFESLDDQWKNYARWVADAQYYPNGALPIKEELDRRISIVDDAFQGIINSTLAVYAVPKKYDLGTICEIFETLNTTGTKVSTVDLIHSWLYSDTINDFPHPFNLRDWIKELGQRPGAESWADPNDRPELIAQFVTSAYIAEKNPPKARPVGGKQASITSVKSGDLLATPKEHWREIQSKEIDFAQYIGAFQDCVASSPFPMASCPYPISAAIYVGLRWTNDIDARRWSLDDLNALYRAFFWRNALRSRYDQGFLTKMASDQNFLIGILEKRSDYTNFGEWSSYSAKELDKIVGGPESISAIAEGLLDAKPAGAYGKALLLPVLTNPIRDILDVSKKIDLISASDGSFEVHHLFPKAWIRDNISSSILNYWNDKRSGAVNSIANLTPMLKVSNQKWSAKIPGRALEDANVTPESQSKILRSHFIDDKGFELLLRGQAGLPEFWEHRASLIAHHLHELTRVQAV
ncbi:DUF262 domain-containing protein [Oceanicaulis sp. LC35]|uniref:GmrSD restriction endonuclease domain-containing protein n=1 Tax=Oceanicaulis sp. LC35 TaxID=3349635 RepID=UPI003F87CA75